jgi:hypothetical protein
MSPGGNRTRRPNKQAVADTRPRPRGHWNLHFVIVADSDIEEGILGREAMTPPVRKVHTSGVSTVSGLGACAVHGRDVNIV